MLTNSSNKRMTKAKGAGIDNRYGKYRTEIENEEYKHVHDHQGSDENQGDVIAIIHVQCRRT